MAIATTFKGRHVALGFIFVLSAAACGSTDSGGDDVPTGDDDEATVTGGSGGKAGSGGSGGKGGTQGGAAGSSSVGGSSPGMAGTNGSSMGGQAGGMGGQTGGTGGQSNGTGGQAGGGPVNPSPTGCGIAADQDTVALWTFESGSASAPDHTGMFPVTWRGGSPSAAPGPDECSLSVQMNGSLFGEVNFTSGFAGLTEGALEMFVWLPPKSDKIHAILAADAKNQKTNGHFVLGYETQGKIVLRMQNAESAPGGGKTFYMCSGPNMPTNQWIHLGINFGPPSVQMFVNGVIAENEGVHFKHGNQQNCGDNPVWSPADNGNPLVVGGATNEATEGIADTVIKRFGGRIDQLRISRKRRDFAVWASKP